MTSLPRKGATSIRSIANRRISHRASAWRKFLRLARLEFEREHRNRDIRLFRERADDDRRRLAEIDDEEGDLTASLEAARRGNVTAHAATPRSEPSDSRSAALVLKY